MELTQNIAKILRQQTRAHGLTQHQLAQKLNVSLPTVKRWYSGSGLSLNQFLKILDVLGISLKDLSEQLAIQSDSKFQYTIEQETYFSHNPQYLAFFDQIYSGLSPKQIQKKHGLSEAELNHFLIRLEKLKLIKLLPQNKVHFLVQGEPQWKKNGPLSKTFKHKALNEFFQNSFHDELKFSILKLSSDDLFKLNEMIQNVMKISQRMDQKNRLLKTDDKTYGLLYAMNPFNWSILNKIK